MALASSWAALPGAARAIDADLSSLPGRDAAQPLSTRLQTHDQTELLMLLDELAPGADADPNSRAVAELLRAGQPDVVADHALDALGRLKSREARSVLTTFTRHRRPGARARAYSALASVADARDLGLIAGGLRDSAPAVRAQVAVLLGQLRATQAVGDLLRAFSLGVHQAAAPIGKLGDVASLEDYHAQLGRLPLSAMLAGYRQYLDRADIPEEAKLAIVAKLEDVSGAVVKAFLTERIDNPSKNTTDKLQKAMITSAGRIRVEPTEAGAQEVQP